MQRPHTPLFQVVVVVVADTNEVEVFEVRVVDLKRGWDESLGTRKGNG